MFRPTHRGSRGWGATLIAVALVIAGAANADEVTSKGTVLKGKVTGVSGSGLTFEPEYGKGALTIDWKNVEDIKTDGAFQVLYGDGLEADAPLQGFSDGKLLVGGDAATATAVPTADLHSGVPLGADGLTWQDKMRSYWRYWDGSADFGVNYQQATVDALGFLVGFQTTRKNAPTRFSIAANYRYSTQERDEDDPNNPGTTVRRKSTIEDRFFGGLRGEYDITDRFYGFAAGDVTYDAIQKLSIRGVPKLGVGYTLWEDKLEDDKRDFLSVEAGGAWVYESYFTSSGTPDNDYFAVAFGAAAGYHLPLGAHIGYKMDYLPSITDFVNDFLLRNALELSMPLIDPISAKLTFLDEYNNNPANGANYNSLYLTFGLAVGW